MKFALVLLFALVMTTLAANHNSHKAHKVIQLSSVPSLKGPVTYNTIPVSIWSDGTVYYSTVPTVAPENPQELATVTTRQVLTGKIDVDNLADFLLFAVDNEYTTLENKYEAKDQEPNPTSTCLTIFDKNGATESCELNDKVAPQLFQDLVCKIRALVASAQDTKPFVPADAYIRAYSISKKGVSAASIWGGKQLLVDSEKGVWFHKKHAAAAFEAAVKGTVFDYQGQYVQLTAQVHGISLVDPSSKADKVHEQNVVNTKLYLVMVIMMALVIAFVLASVVFFMVRMCSKVVKAYESDEHLVGDEEEGHSARSDDESSDEEFVKEDERPLLSIQTEEEPVAVQQQFVAPEHTQYFYVIPQNSVVFPNEQYALPNNFGPFPQALPFTPEQQ